MIYGVLTVLGVAFLLAGIVLIVINIVGAVMGSSPSFAPSGLCFLLSVVLVAAGIYGYNNVPEEEIEAAIEAGSEALSDTVENAGEVLGNQIDDASIITNNNGNSAPDRKEMYDGSDFTWSPSYGK